MILSSVLEAYAKDTPKYKNLKMMKYGLVLNFEIIFLGLLVRAQNAGSL